MKKIVLLVLCLILSGFCLTSCRKDDEPFEEKTYTSDTQISEICLDVRDREIEVSLSEDNRVHIQYFENSKEYYDISVSDRQVLTMSSAYDKEWTDYIGGKTATENRKILLQIPNESVNVLTLSTTNENISLSTLTVTKQIHLSSNGGNIVFEDLNVGDALFLTVKNGDIAGTVNGSYDDFAVQSEIKKGQSNLPDQKTGGEKTLQVSANNGDVDITFENNP